MNEELPIVKPGLRFSLREMFFTITIVGVAIALMAPLIVTAREEARRLSSLNNAKQIMLAMYNYHDAFGCFPRAIDRDSVGTPMRSWRVTISPYLEASDFYSRYDQQQAWNSAVNDALGRQYAFGEHVYNRPGNTRLNRHCTNFVTIIGPGTLFPDDRCTCVGEIRDGTSNTIMVAEIDHSDILWYAPRDYPASELSRQFNRHEPGKLCLGSRNSRGAIVGFADGSARLLSQDISPEIVTAYFTIAAKDGGHVDLCGN